MKQRETLMTYSIPEGYNEQELMTKIFRILVDDEEVFAPSLSTGPKGDFTRVITEEPTKDM